MPIYQRGKTWWITFTKPNGERVRVSSKTQNKKQAEELHDKLKAESWRVAKLGEHEKHTWQEAVVKWFQDMGHKRSIETDTFHLRFLDDHFADKTLDEIDKQAIEKAKAAKLATGVSNATVNRMLSLIRAILNKAKNDWEWLDTVPSIKMLPEPVGRVRWLNADELGKLLRELPPHLNAMVRFSLATGLRESNVTGLEWAQVDMVRRKAWIHADDSKSGKAIAVPLNDDAVQVLREQIGRHQVRVFTYKGEPVTKAGGKAWRKALKRAGISDFRYHDLRHTWASQHAMNGTPLNVIKELGGWHDLDMVMRYAHLSSEHLSQYAGNSSTMSLSVNAKMTQSTLSVVNK